MPLLQIILVSSTVCICVCTVVLFILSRKNRQYETQFLLDIDESQREFQKALEKTFEIHAEKNLKTLANACSDGTKLLENKHKFLLDASSDVFALKLSESRNELRKEISAYREELLESLYAARNETETKVAESKKEALIILASLASEMRTTVTDITHDFMVKLKVFSQEAKQLLDQHYQMRKRDLDIQHDEIKEKLLEIFPVEKRSVWMNLSKGGFWTNKAEEKKQ